MNNQSICIKCVNVFRPHVIKEDKCPKCNYEYTNKTLINEFRSYASLEEYDLSKINFMNYSEFKCIFCENFTNQIEGIDCCQCFINTCFVCYSNSKNFEKCPFIKCSKVLNIKTIEFLLNKFKDNKYCSNPYIQVFLNSKFSNLVFKK